MRTIKFRGKSINKCEWLFGDLMHDNFGGSYIFPIEAENLYKENAVIPETVGQYTGLMDKNGKEIYEGDIYRYDNPDSINEVSYCAGGGFAGFDLTPAKHSENRLLDVEVIGNIHDNPELLKGE